MAGKLGGKSALVTGASSGIGEATALALAAEGAKVALVARREDRLRDLAGRIKSAGGADPLVVVCDASDEAQIAGAVAGAEEAFGGLDILVNNAGVMLLGPIVGADTEDWRRMINLNVLGLMYATHAAVGGMRARKAGHIVNVSSTAGRGASKGAGVYCASKWAVGAFSESLRQEVVADRIRVTLIEPGVVETELRDHITHEETKATIEAWAQSMEQLQSEDIAAAIVYAVTQPPRVNVNEILVRPTDQER